MKKLILMTMILFSITSAYADTKAPDPAPSASKSGHGQTSTTCPAGDDSGRSTTPPKKDTAPAAPATTGKGAVDGK